MKFSYSWLKELSGTKKSPEAVAKLLVMHSFEVEEMIRYEHHLDGVIIGNVVGLERHPNADKLRVAEVSLGRGDIRKIVCGAPNITLGQNVAVATVGTILPGNRRIEEASIRGVVSHGMICSEKELGLGDDHGGIMVLPEDLTPGTLFAKHFQLDDTIFDIKVLPDRPDALAYQGMAHEIAALDGRAVKVEKKVLKALSVPVYNRAPKLAVTDKKACPRYIGVLIQNVKLGSAPLLVKSRLLLSGLRPVNNVVDITNYLMLLSGQPLHAFDADKISGGVTVRRAKKNEKLELLTGSVLRLTPDDLVIADQKKVLALAGVMGGASSAITDTTENIFVEVAHFDPVLVRRTRTRHHLTTDASYRFERGVDPELPTSVSREAAKLLTEVTGGRLMGRREVTSRKWPDRKIVLSLDLVEKVLGLKIPLFAVVQYLALLGLKVKKQDSKLIVTVGTERPDLLDEWDLIEEIGRLHGYDEVEPQAPLIPLGLIEPDPLKMWERVAKERLATMGFDEIMTYSFYGEKEKNLSGLDQLSHIEMENPMNPDQEFLRISLLPNLLRKIRENLRHFRSFHFFEYGSVFEAGKSGFLEEKKLGLATVEEAGQGGEGFAFLKGKLEVFLAAAEIEGASYVPLTESERLSPLFHRTRAAQVRAKDIVLGVFGELSPQILRRYGLPPGIAVGEFRAEALARARRTEGVFVPLQKYPFALRDISLIFPKKVTVGEVEAVFAQAGPLLQKAELFDVYEQGEEKSLAFHLSFGAPDRTLSSQEMDRVFDDVVKKMEEKLGGKLRLSGLDEGKDS